MLASIDLGGLLRQFSNPEGLLMVGMLLLLVLLAQVIGKGKGKITTLTSQRFAIGRQSSTGSRSAPMHRG